MSRSLSRFLLSSCLAGRGFALDAAPAGEPSTHWFCASGTSSLPALFPSPPATATAAPALLVRATATTRWIFYGGVFCPNCSCQEPAPGEGWSCSSLPSACISSCFLVTSSSLPTPGVPSASRSVWGGCEPGMGGSVPLPAPPAHPRQCPHGPF